MKASNYIKRLSIINIKKKKQRTILSIVSVGLSVAIIFTSLILLVNIYSLSKNTSYQDVGNFHYAISSNKIVDANQRYDISYDYNSHQYAKINDTYLNIREIAFSNQSVESNPSAFCLIDGRYPSDQSEIVLDEALGYKVGDTIILDISKIQTDTSDKNSLYQLPKEFDFITTKESRYTVVGIYQNYDLMKEYTNGISFAYSVISEKDSFVIYVKDSLIELTSHYNSLLNYFEVNENQTYYNSNAISLDVIHHYLQDTTTLLLMFVIIIVIALLISLITIQNIILMSDKERKKELGLLKSIGATTLDVKKLISNELLILGFLGSIVGMILGLGISYVVLNLLISNLYITFTYTMIFKPTIMLISVIIGMILILTSGFKMYSKYITSYPISDLKDTASQYDPPNNPKSVTRKRSFAYQLFIIYNGRMKAQSKNITYSFTLFIFTMILFFSVFISNTIYKTQYKTSTYDLEISNFSEQTYEYAYPNLELDYKIYEYTNNGEINVSNIYTMRRFQSYSIYTNVNSLDSARLASYKKTASSEVLEKKVSGDTYVKIQSTAAIFDEYQLNALKDYVVSGSLEQIKENEVVCILSKGENFELYSNLKVGDSVYLEDKELTVKAIVKLYGDNLDSNLYFNYTTQPRVFALSSAYLEDYYKLEDVVIIDRIQITLANKSSISLVIDLIDEAINESGLTNQYVYTSDLLVLETNRFTSFILESLLYPLFLLLMIISIININNVLLSNVHIKRNDISIMKSVGMNNAQLQLLFIFEYAEGYLNAALLSIGIFVPLCIVEGILKIASSFTLSDNIFSTVIITLFTVGIFIIIPLVVLSLRKISSILPIENMKDVI